MDHERPRTGVWAACPSLLPYAWHAPRCPLPLHVASTADSWRQLRCCWVFPEWGPSTMLSQQNSEGYILLTRPAPAVEDALSAVGVLQHEPAQRLGPPERSPKALRRRMRPSVCRLFWARRLAVSRLGGGGHRGGGGLRVVRRRPLAGAAGRPPPAAGWEQPPGEA